MSEYTKGTWTLNDRTGEILSGPNKIAEVYGATIHNNEDNADECFSNAQLIINAPELFSLVNSLMFYAYKYYNQTGEQAFKFAVGALIDRAETIIKRIDQTWRPPHED